MKRHCGWAVAILMLTGAGQARAEDSPIKLGLSSGYSAFAGNAIAAQHECVGKTCAGSSDPSYFISGQIPLELDAGIRVTPELSLGLYGQYGFAALVHCDSCSGHDVSFGIRAEYRLLPQSPIGPWLGLGVGYETLSLSQLPVGVASTSDMTLSGFELVKLRAGIDFPLSRTFSLAPFLEVSVDQFTHLHDQYEDAALDDKTLHEWIALGLALHN